MLILQNKEPVESEYRECPKFDKITPIQLMYCARTLGHRIPEESYAKFKELPESPQ